MGAGVTTGKAIGHEEVVEMLLEREDVNPDKKTRNVAGRRSRGPLGKGMKE